MEPILIHFNENAYNNHISTFKPHLTALNNILSDYKALGLKPLTEAEFKGLFRSVPDVIFDKMTDGQPVSIGSLVIDRSKALDILKKPSGYEQLLASVHEYKKIMYSDHVLINSELSNNEVRLTTEFLENEKHGFEIWVRTEDSLKAYTFAKSVIESADAIFGENKVNIHSMVYNFIDSKAYMQGVGNANQQPKAVIQNNINNKVVAAYGPGYNLVPIE